MPLVIGGSTRPGFNDIGGQMPGYGLTPGAGSPGGEPSVGLPNPNSQAGLDAAQKAVTGLQSAGPGMAANTPYTQGGAGSSYSVGPDGTNYTVTPNMIPQETAATKDINDQQNTAASALAKQQADAEAALLAQKASLSGQAFNSRLAAVGGSGTSAPQVTPQSVGGASSEAARNAAFARAKDQAGLTGNAAMQGLKDAIGARGLQGSSIEQSGMADVLGGTAGSINDFTRDQLTSDLNRSSQLQDETYQGAITQRGQDLQRQQAILQLLNAGPLF